MTEQHEPIKKLGATASGALEEQADATPHVAPIVLILSCKYKPGDKSSSVGHVRGKGITFKRP